MKNNSFGTIVRTSRRFVTIADESANLIQAQLSSRHLDAVIGDKAIFQESAEGAFVTEILKRKNCLVRASDRREQSCAANIDFLFIVTAVSPLFNKIFIDRVIAAAVLEEIPFAIIVNKIDLGLSETESDMEIYKKLNLELLTISCKEDKGIQEIRTKVFASNFSTIALTGNSGVGKTTLLNLLVPGAKERTAEVSDKTGQGRQTTTTPYGFPVQGASGETIYLIDLPGSQNFGVAHLDLDQLQFGFEEIARIAQNCQFNDCKHRQEPKCAVKAAVEAGEISASRLASLHSMADEIIRLKAY